MKRFSSVLIGLILLISTPAFAIPTLQLDISNGTYNPFTETITATTGSFTLYALLNNGYSGDAFYISMALTPSTSSAGNYGSLVFNGETIDVTQDMVYGIPPMDAAVEQTAGGDSMDLQTHAIYPTYFTQLQFSFDPNNQVGVYNSQDAPGGFDSYAAGTGAYFAGFNVDATGLSPNTTIHFDLFRAYEDDNGNLVIPKGEGNFAPFSHDAETAPVPEPATLLLLGTGLIGLAGFSRKKLLKK